MRRLLGLALLALLLLPKHSLAASAPCKPFRIHMSAALPAEPSRDFDPSLRGREWESGVLSALERKAGQASIREHYLRAKTSRLGFSGENDAKSWLHCVAHYLSVDTDKDGVQDWSALVDRNPARVLIPLDEDMDGDGVENILDPSPSDPKIKGAEPAGSLPAHLRLEDGHGLAALQSELYRDFGVIAVNHTDSHSPVVLQELLFLLRNGLPASARHLRNFRVIYSFAGHDPRVDIAAFHAESRAISIGGMKSYGSRPLEPRERVHVLASLAHELGHALVFERITVSELREAGERFGNWKSVFGDTPVESFYDRVFFMPNPLRARKLAELGPPADLREHNVTSSYALKNVHEWFADAFAGYVLNRMGVSRLLGEQWQGLLSRRPASHTGGWVDYNNVSPQLSAWFDARLQGGASPFAD